MSRFVSACLCAVMALVSVAGASLVSPVSVFAADGTLTMETPLHEAPDHGSPLVALLAEGTVVTIDGPPIDGFYPVSTGGMTGWMRGETLALTKDIVEEQVEATAPEEGIAETVPIAQEASEAPLEADQPAPPTNQTTDAPADGAPLADPTLPGETAAEPIQSPETMTEPAQADETANDHVPAQETPFDLSAAPVSDGGLPPADSAWVEPEPMAAPAAVEPIPADLSSEPTTGADDPNQLSPEPEIVTPVVAEATPAAPAADAAPATDTGETAPAPVATTSDPAATVTADPEPAPAQEPLGPAGVVVDMPIRSGPGSDYGLIFTVPMGSTVEQTGQIVNGFISVRYKEVVGWAAAEHMADPSDFAAETPEATVEPVDTKTPKPGSGVAFATIDLSLRSGPSANAEPIVVVPAGSRLILTGVMEGDFQRVTYGDDIGWIANEYLETPEDPAPNGEAKGKQENYSRREIIRYITQAAKRYDQSPEDMVRVAQCESNLDPYAVNPSGSYGLFQFIRSTWKSTPYGNEDIFDPQANSNAAAWMWSQGRKSEWVCQ